MTTAPCIRLCSCLINNYPKGRKCLADTSTVALQFRYNKALPKTLTTPATLKKTPSFWQ